jgi:hypothetical protein
MFNDHVCNVGVVHRELGSLDTQLHVIFFFTESFHLNLIAK